MMSMMPKDESTVQYPENTRRWLAISPMLNIVTMLAGNKDWERSYTCRGVGQELPWTAWACCRESGDWN